MAKRAIELDGKPTRIKTIQGLYRNAVRWTQGVYQSVNYDVVAAEECECFCLVGAVRQIYGPNTEKGAVVLRKLARVIKKVNPDYFWGSKRSPADLVIGWNDDGNRTIAEVRKVCRLANV